MNNIGNNTFVIVTYKASYVVCQSTSTGHEMNKDGSIHDEASGYYEVVEVWTGESNNPA